LFFPQTCPFVSINTVFQGHTCTFHIYCTQYIRRS
jgi:hypothetical protein